MTNGGLKKWSTKTTRSRGLREGASNVADITIDTEDLESEEEDMWGADDNQDETDTPSQMTFGVMHSKDGEMVVKYEGDDKDVNGDETADGT